MLCVSPPANSRKYFRQRFTRGSTFIPIFMVATVLLALLVRSVVYIYEPTRTIPNVYNVFLQKVVFQSVVSIYLVLVRIERPILLTIIIRIPAIITTKHDLTKILLDEEYRRCFGRFP